MEYVTLNNGVEMPIIGFGVYQITDMAECERIVGEAITAGYRSFDTSAAYFNEEAVGRAIAKSDVPREEFFITTKLWIQDASYEAAKGAYQASLDRLGLDFLDLYLIHQPFGDYYGAWRAMEELYEDKKVRAIGVSNFDDARLADLIIHNKVAPVLNQVETHPFFQQKTAIETMKKYGVQIESWGPFAQGGNNIFLNPALLEIAEAHGKSVGQVVLRWHIQRGVVVIPKSTNPNRMKQNLDVFDFELTKEDMGKIAELDLGHSELIDYLQAASAEMLNSLKVHE
ncbi:2,5-diketo-D-gluconic acid reductase [Paenibacillus sp. PK3_47]|uniref:aldo/keto reductase n=1 Tax=Paenibacillus sp. PK3_47 TaxID=2072642 RepID=UPI00201D8CA8|nr:aldo/keto reductase [Paenibacillus sp. PK3_47]UQZ35499.1 2,5-diketo-D-gluconic acid reductase [Paenibacillus sp. PK3_47]